MQMKIFKAFKYKLEPNNSQIELLYRMAGCGALYLMTALIYC
ncbi:MAG TPA: hypothetical protein DCR64_11065 [Vibrio sp.]|nr:hypothetical protein [Vibrio sp.]